MNVRLTPRRHPERTELYGGITDITSDGATLFLWRRVNRVQAVAEAEMPLAAVAEIALDEAPGDWW